MKRISAAVHYSSKKEVNMAGAQGRRLSDAEVARIKHLLMDTEMSIPEIATRMGCSKGPILAINRRFGIRNYNGKRSCWQMSSSPRSEETVPI